jgi:hypothetical protein
MTSTTVGFASQWSLSLKKIKPKEDREEAVPDGDVVIFYPPQGAFRIINATNNKVVFTSRILNFCGPSNITSKSNIKRISTSANTNESNPICKQGEQKHDQAHQHARLSIYLRMQCGSLSDTLKVL